MKREVDSICQMMNCVHHLYRCLTVSEHKSLAIMVPDRYSRQIYFHRYPEKYIYFLLLLLLLFSDCLAFKKSPTSIDTFNFYDPRSLILLTN